MQKDMSKLHDLKRFGQVVKDKNAILRNHKSGGTVDMRWGWNDEASIDQVFALRFKGKDGKTQEVFLDWQEVMHYGRAVSDWKYAYEKLKEEAERQQGLR